MKKFIIVLSLLIISSVFLFGQVNKPDYKLRNTLLKEQNVTVAIDSLAKNYIAAYMERNEGRFTIKAREGNRNLLYGGILSGGAVYTSHANFKIGGQLFTMRPALSGATKVMPRIFNNDNNKMSVTYYECNGVEVRQELIPRENITKKAGAVLIKYVFINKSSETKKVGAVLKLDTYIGGYNNITGSDTARLSTPIGLIRNQQEISPVSDYWLAFENIQDTAALIGRGTLKGKDLVFPDYLFVGNYEQLTTYKYDETLQSGGPYYDSEILMRWKEKDLAPGDSTYYSTLYGMGEIEYQGNTLSLYCSTPFDTLSMDANSDYEVNPFDYLVSVRNPGLTINNVKATIRLNNNTFYLYDPADSVRYLGALAGGEQKLVNWKIYTKNQCSSKEENIKVIVTGESSDTNYCITKIYVPANRLYALNLVVDPPGGGVATKTPEKFKYECNVPITIQTFANPGYKFIGWEGVFSGDKMENPKTLYLDADKTIIAKFMVDSFNLDVKVSPVGSGHIKLSGKTVVDGIYRFKNGSNVELSYDADSCYQFTGWSGDTTLPANVNLFMVNMWKNKAITANFLRKTYKITGEAVGSGDVEIIPNPTNSDGSYNCGDSVTLRAHSKNCYSFNRWEYKIGYDTGSILSAVVGFRIYADISGTAYFTIDKFDLHTTIEPGTGTLTKSPDKEKYNCGDVVVLSVTPDKCYTFVSWDDGDKNNPRTLILNEDDITLKAVLERKKFTVTTSLDYPNSGTITKTPAKDTCFCGDTVKVELFQNCQYSFVKWSDGVLTRNRPVYVDTNKVLLANMSKTIFDVVKSEPNIFPNIVVDLKVDSVLLNQNPVLIPALVKSRFTVIDEDTAKNQKTISNFNLLEGANGYQIIYSLYGNCFDKATDLNRKTIVTFTYNSCAFTDTARYKINLNSGCDSCSRMLKRKTTENALMQNYPNPGNPETKIRYSIINNENVHLVVYDLLGREVAILVNGYKEAGEYEVTFTPRGLPSGVYLYRIKTDSFNDVKKMLFLK